MDLVLRSRLPEELAYKIAKMVHQQYMRELIKKINKISYSWSRAEGWVWMNL